MHELMYVRDLINDTDSEEIGILFNEIDTIIEIYPNYENDRKSFINSLLLKEPSGKTEILLKDYYLYNTSVSNTSVLLNIEDDIIIIGVYDNSKISNLTEKVQMELDEDINLKIESEKELDDFLESKCHKKILRLVKENGYDFIYDNDIKIGIKIENEIKSFR